MITGRDSRFFLEISLPTVVSIQQLEKHKHMIFVIFCENAPLSDDLLRKFMFFMKLLMRHVGMSPWIVGPLEG